MRRLLQPRKSKMPRSSPDSTMLPVQESMSSGMSGGMRDSQQLSDTRNGGSDADESCLSKRLNSLQ